MPDQVLTPKGARIGLQDDIGFLVSIARSIFVRRANEALELDGIRVRSYSLLAMAADSGGITQSEAAGVLRLNPSQVVALVDELEGRGLVERRAHPTDRRARVIAATDAGRRLCDVAGGRLADALDVALQGLADSERTALHDLLQKLIRSADEADVRG